MVFSSKTRVLDKVRDLLKNSLAIHSELQEKGVENCLQPVTKDSFLISRPFMNPEAQLTRRVLIF